MSGAAYEVRLLVSRLERYDPRTAEMRGVWAGRLTWNGQTGDRSSSLMSSGGVGSRLERGTTFEADSLAGVFEQAARLVGTAEGTIIADLDGASRVAS